MIDIPFTQTQILVLLAMVAAGLTLGAVGWWLLRRYERAELVAVDEYEAGATVQYAQELHQITEDAPDPDGWSAQRGFDYLDAYRRVVESQDLVAVPAATAQPEPVEPALYGRLSGWHGAICESFDRRWLECTTDWTLPKAGV